MDLITVIVILAIAILLIVGIQIVPPEKMVKRVRPRSPFEPGVYRYFSQNILQAGPELDVHGPGLKFYIRFLEKLEEKPYGEVGPNQIGVLIGRYGPACSGVYAPLIPVKAFESMSKTMQLKFEAGLNTQYIVGQWKGIYDWKQYLLVTADNIDALKQADEGKRLIPPWLKKENLLFSENKPGGQLLVSCRGKIRKAESAYSNPATTKMREDKDNNMPKFTEVRRIIRPKGFGEILEHGINLLKEAGYIQKQPDIPAKKEATKPKENKDIDFGSLEEVEKALVTDSSICKAMLDLLLKSNNKLHKNYTDIEAFMDCFGGEVEPGALLYGVDEVAHHAIPGHIFEVKEAPLVHIGSGQIFTIDAAFGILSAVQKKDPVEINKPLAELTVDDRIQMYRSLYENAQLVPPGFVGISLVTIPTATTWAVRPESFRFEPGRIGEKTYFFGESPELYGERQVDKNLGAISMTDADGNQISLDIDLRTQARPRFWPRLRYVFGYVDESVVPAEAQKIISWTEFNLMNTLVAPILNGIIAEIIGGRRTVWFYGEGKEEGQAQKDVQIKKKELRALEEISNETNEKMTKILGFLGIMFVAMVKKRIGPKEFEEARRGKSIAAQSLETAKMETDRNIEQAEALVAEADGKARAEAIQELRRNQALIQSVGKEGAMLLLALEKAKIPNMVAVGSGVGTDASIAAAVSVGIIQGITNLTKEIAPTVPDSPLLESKKREPIDKKEKVTPEKKEEQKKSDATDKTL